MLAPGQFSCRPLAHKILASNNVNSIWWNLHFRWNMMGELPTRKLINLLFIMLRLFTPLRRIVVLVDVPKRGFLLFFLDVSGLVWFSRR